MNRNTAVTGGIGIIVCIILVFLLSGCIGSGTSTTAGTYEGNLGLGTGSTVYKGDSHVSVRGSYGKWHRIEYTIYLYLYDNGEVKMRHIFEDQYSPKHGTFRDWENEYHGKWEQDNTNVYLDFEEISTYASITSNDELRKEPATKNLPPELIDEESGIHLYKEEGVQIPKIPTGEEKGIPGFEAIFVVMGLLVVAYILRRWKK